MNSKSLSVLITGVAGFIGSNLADHLLRLGHRVTGIDNFSYGEKRNIAPFLSNPNFAFYERDICQPSSLKDMKVDVLVHLASYKIPRYSGAFVTLESNTEMTKNVVKHCIQNKIKIIYAS